MDGSRGPGDPHLTAGTLTLLFTDLAGSTQLWERFPLSMKGALNRHDIILREAIEASGGQVVKTTGDGMMAVFRTAVDGVTASLAAQRGLAHEPWAETGALRVRMGLHAGEAERRAGDYFGPTVNRTARIMSAGHGGQVLLSASAAALAIDGLPDRASLRDLGEHRLKDLGRAERVFQLVHPDLPSTFPPLTTFEHAPSNLPARAAAFVGRGAELEEIARRLGDPTVRLLTLTGPGGTGKTSLAIRAATDQVDHFPDGVFFVDLSAAVDTGTVVVAIARVIGLDETIDRPLLLELIDRLRKRWTLLVLDNFEQVTEAASVATQLLQGCPEIKLLVTSREALHVRAEHLYPVPPLTLPPAGVARPTASELARYEAVQLFVDRARAVRPDFELTDENAAAVGEICLRLDGLPLAIELATARLRLFSPEALRDRLGSRLELLGSGPRDLPARQQTLRATIEWSYQLLEPPEQRLFELLAVLYDSDVAAVEKIAAAAGGEDGIELDPIDGLGSLLEKSLIRQVDVAHREQRLVMLETIREYATERLNERPDFGSRVRRAHATYFADFARHQLADLGGSGRESALLAMAAEVENLRIAWRYWIAAPELDQLNKLADSLLVLNDARGWYLDTVVLTTDLLTVLGMISSRPDLVSQEIALRTSLARALMVTKGFTPEVEEAYARALELFERGGELRQHVSVLRGLAGLYLLRAEFDKANRLGQEILELGERKNDPGMMIDGHLVLGSTLAFMSDLQGGLEHLDRAIALFGSSPVRSRSLRLGNDPRVACFTTSAFTLWLLGFPDRALERTTAAIALANDLDHPFTSAYARFHAGLLHLWRREPDLVLERAIGVLEIADDHDFQVWTAVGTCLLGAAQTGLGRFDEGLGQIRKGMDLYQGLRTPPVFWPMLLFIDAGASHLAGRSADGLATIDAAIDLFNAGAGSVLLPELYLLKGDIRCALDSGAEASPAGAEQCYQRGFDLARDLGARMSQLRAATKLCGLSQERGRGGEAVRVLGAVHETFTEGFDTPDLREAREILAAVGKG